MADVYAPAKKLYFREEGRHPVVKTVLVDTIPAGDGIVVGVAKDGLIVWASTDHPYAPVDLAAVLGDSHCRWVDKP